MNNADGQMQIEQRDSGDGGSLLLKEPGGVILGKLTYRWRNGVMAIDHTEVPPPLRGKGLAKLLVQDAIRRAREDGFEINPVCSYVAKLFELWGEKVDDVRA